MLWVCVTNDGNTVTVKCLDGNEVSDPPTDGEWSDANACYSSTGFPGSGGYVGFATGPVYIDNLTIRSDRDGDGTFESDETELVEPFTVSGSYAEHRPAHDAAGNMVYDALHKYTYDGWNRLAKVERAYRDSGGALQTGSTIATIQYDGLHRRTTKMIDNCGDWDSTENGDWLKRSEAQTCLSPLYVRWRLLETRNGSGDTLKQHLWGGRYVDELVQIAVNDDPSDANEQDCESLYYAMQNANFNVLGLADANGTLVERYEYTPGVYPAVGGQRTVYKKAGTNDALTTAPLYHSQPVTADGAAQPHTLCAIGHQGLMHDKEFGLVCNRMRYLDPRTGRWSTRDPAGYVDGMSLYEYCLSGPLRRLDAGGQTAKTCERVLSVKLTSATSFRWLDKRWLLVMIAPDPARTFYDKLRGVSLSAEGLLPETVCRIVQVL